MSRTFTVGLALLLSAAGIGIALFMDSTLGRFMMIAAMPAPDHSFNASHAEDAPDYSLASSWLAHSEIADNTDWKAEGEQAALNAVETAYVFLIHPTAFLGNDHWMGDDYVRTADPWVCVNPLSWEYNQKAVSARENPGSMPAQNEYTLFSFGRDETVGLTWGVPEGSVQGIASAQCVDGVLRTEEVEPGPFDGLSWGGNYHSLDYALYYDSIAQNASECMRAWWSQKRLSAQN